MRKPVGQATPNASNAKGKSEGVVTIGKGTKVHGDIFDCSMVEIEGILEGKIVADAVAIKAGGGFRGTMQTDSAEVHGIVEGTVTVYELLAIHSTGSVTGEVSYGRLAIADGGILAGSVQNSAEEKVAFAPTPTVAADNDPEPPIKKENLNGALAVPVRDGQTNQNSEVRHQR